MANIYASTPFPPCDKCLSNIAVTIPTKLPLNPETPRMPEFAKRVFVSKYRRKKKCSSTYRMHDILSSLDFLETLFYLKFRACPVLNETNKNCPVLSILLRFDPLTSDSTQACKMPCSASNSQNILLHIMGTFCRMRVGHLPSAVATVDLFMAVHRRRADSSGPRVLHPVHRDEPLHHIRHSHRRFLRARHSHVFPVLAYMAGDREATERSSEFTGRQEGQQQAVELQVVSTLPHNSTQAKNRTTENPWFDYRQRQSRQVRYV